MKIQVHLSSNGMDCRASVSSFLAGQTQSFEFHDDSIVRDLRQRAIAAFEITGQHLRLFFHGKSLEDPAKLSDCGIADGCTVLGLIVNEPRRQLAPDVEVRCLSQY